MWDVTRVMDATMLMFMQVLGTIPSQYSRALTTLIGSMLQLEPMRRPSALTLITAHAYT